MFYIRKFTLLLILIFSSYSYSCEIGVSKIINYEIKNQSVNRKVLSISFEKKHFYNFDSDFNNPEYFNWRSSIEFKQKSDLLNKHNCKERFVKVLNRLRVVNKHHSVLKVIYKEDYFKYYYSEPIQVIGCNIVIVYKEKRHYSGAGFLVFFELTDNELAYISSWEVMNAD